MRPWVFLAILCVPLGACAERPAVVSADSAMVALAPTEPPLQRIPTGAGLIACYRKIYVPAVFRIDTEGHLVKRERRFFEVVREGDHTRWNKVVEPAVFIETKRLLHKDHYTLERVDCPA
jgi:hypothetical protein